MHSMLENFIENKDSGPAPMEGISHRTVNRSGVTRGVVRVAGNRMGSHGDWQAADECLRRGVCPASGERVLLNDRHQPGILRLELSELIGHSVS